MYVPVSVSFNDENGSVREDVLLLSNRIFVPFNQIIRLMLSPSDTVALHKREYISPTNVLPEDVMVTLKLVDTANRRIIFRTEPLKV